MGEKSPVTVPLGRGAVSWAGGASLLSAVLPFVLYVSTLAPTVYGVDSAELTTGAYLLGIVHPPGAPTYLLLGHFFSWLPLGDVGYRLNLMSACSVATSLFLLHRILLRLECSPTLGLATVLFVGVSYYVWISAVVAEVYSLQGCFAAGLILLALRVRKGGGHWELGALGFLFGVGLGVHPSLALLAPGLTLLVLTGPQRPAFTALLTSAGSILLGALVYLYLPIRSAADLPLNPARDSWRVDLTSWHGFWWMATSRGFSHLFFAVPLVELGGELRTYVHQVWSNFMGMGALIAVWGLIVGLRRDRAVHVSLLSMLVMHVAFFLPYGAGDKQLMFLPTYLLWGVWIGVAAQAFAKRFDRLGAAGSGHFVAAATLAGMALMTAAVNFRLTDVSDDRSARERGEALLEELAPHASLFCSFPDCRIVEYLQFVEGRRGDIETNDSLFTDLPVRRRRIIDRLSTGVPVYVRSCDEWQPPDWRCEVIGDLGIARLSKRSEIS